MGKFTKKLPDSILGVLSRLVVTPDPAGYVARINDGQLDCKVYVAFNEAVEALGGKWNRRARGHLFDHDPTDALDQLVLTGEFRTKFAGDFYQTPPELARRMVAWAVRPGDLVLEPSVGHGRIAYAIGMVTDRVQCFEVDQERASKVAATGYSVRCTDFLAVLPTSEFDAVVMNPPFSKGQECRHVMHAMNFLRPGGRLVSVMSAGIRFRQDRVYEELRAALGLALNGRDLLETRTDAANVEDLPEGTFSAEGTDVNTVLVTWTKP